MICGLADIFLSRLSVSESEARRERIRQQILATSRSIQIPNFVYFNDRDLWALYEHYDRLFFDRQLSKAVSDQGEDALELRYSGRLRSSGGVTRRIRYPNRPHFRFVIEISRNILLQNFRTPCETATVAGRVCNDRLDALMRIMEHELLHLVEYLVFDQTCCADLRFQSVAYAVFGHTAHQHAMTTRRSRVLADTPFRPGHRVCFTLNNQKFQGIINRIHTRATVLVESSQGQQYNDGKRYLKFYVPIRCLRRLD